MAKNLKSKLGPRPLTQDLSKSEHEKRADELEGFEGSVGWLSNFKQRHSIDFKGNQGEAADINLDTLRKWQEEVLFEAISKYSPDDVFNADETGLFWQLLPDKTLTFKGFFYLYVIFSNFYVLRLKESDAHQVRGPRNVSQCWLERT